MESHIPKKSHSFILENIVGQYKLDYHLFSKDDFRFRDLQNTLDSVCISLRKEGIGATRNALKKGCWVIPVLTMLSCTVHGKST